MSRSASKRQLTALLLYSLLIIGIILLADLGATGGRGSEYLGIIHAVPAGDKFGHFFLFGGLSFLANMVLGGRLKTVTTHSFRKHLLLSTTILTIVWLEEFSQLYIPNRNFDLWDMFADAAGVLMFGILAMGILRFSRRQARQN